jgi:hypothetical protein
LCLSEGLLTADHIPPKAAYRPSQVDLVHITDLLALDRPRANPQKRSLQSGLSFRTLCADCNNAVLGAGCDPALIEFSSSVHALLRTFLTLSEIPRVRVRPGLVARAVLGHLFAVGLNRTERTPTLREAQSFVLDEKKPMPPEIDIYYWLYPYRNVVAIRDAGLIPDLFGGKKDAIVFWCLKFFPLAFMVTLGIQEHQRLLLPNLRDFMINAGTHNADIPIQLVRVPHQHWPESPGDDGILLYGDGAFGAVPRGAA